PEPGRPAADGRRAGRPRHRIGGEYASGVPAGRGDRPGGTRRRAGSRVPPPGAGGNKYWVCKRAPAHAAEALECLGGNGYVEESGMPRLYREAPLASIWEGSGNVQCLDALRAMVKDPASVEAFFAEVEAGAGAEPRLKS